MSEELRSAISALLEEELWKVQVHICDEYDMEVRAKGLVGPAKDLYNAFIKEKENV